MLRELKRQIWVFLNNITPSETIAASKKKWNELAEKNARYFIKSDFGENIDEKLFTTSGADDYRALVTEDTWLHERLAPFSEKTVLEIGCGMGRLTQCFAKDFAHVTGVDISDTMIERARARLQDHKNITFFATDGVSFPVPSESVNFVFSYIVFQHMPDTETVKKNFAEAARVLKPGGVMKIQIRGLPTVKKQWYYGPSFNLRQITSLLADMPVSIVKSEGEYRGYFWLWLEKK